MVELSAIAVLGLLPLGEGIMARMKLKVREQEKSSINVFTIDCFKDGVELGRTSLARGQDPREHLSLAIPDFSKKLSPRSRHAGRTSEHFIELEQRLQLLYLKGELENSCIYLGVQTDPFFPFEGKFDVTIKLLKLLEKYKPSRLVIQTRSPLIVIAIGSLKALADRVSVTMVLETCSDKIAARYTPEFPSVTERVKAMSALKRFNISVDAQVAPMLPYGKMAEDAGKFADILVKYADHIYLQPLCPENSSAATSPLSDLIIGAVAANYGSHWLSPDSTSHLQRAINKRAPQKLEPRNIDELFDKQLSMF